MAGTPANVSRFNVAISGLEQSVDVLSFEGRGGISQLYEYQIECCTSQAIEPLTTLLQSNVCLTLVDTEQPHFIHGIIRQAQYMGSTQALSRYCFTLVPRLWYLTQRRNQRLFQQQAIPAIIKQVLQGVGIGEQDVTLQLSHAYSALDLVTQYNETDYEFLSRLMANQGMHFHFRHHADHHQLLIADHNQAFADISGQLDIRYMPEDRLPREQSIIRQLHHQQRLTANQLQVGDFSYQKPGFDLLSTADVEVALPLGEIAQFHYRSHQYGGEAQVQQQAVRFADVLRQQQSMQRQEVRLASDDIRLQAGYCFAIKEHGKTGLNQRWLLTHYQVKANQPQSAIQLTTPQAAVYNIKARAIAARQPFVAPACFVKPGIGGVQTAFVTGPADEEIYTDKLGRVKLKFHWDRRSATCESSSAWVRCRQMLAGKQWGSQRIPRIAEEVLVRFEERDPDRPVVVGALYNADNKPPFPLPKEQARSGLQTCSTPKGKDYQEISINDQQGEEQIRVRGSRDLDLIVQRNRHELIQGDWHLMIGGSQYQYLAGNAHAQIKKSARQRWHRDLHRQVGGNYQLNVNGAQVSQVTQQTHLKAGSKLVLETEGQLSVRVGASFITLDASGITIGGTLVRLNQGGQGASSATSANPEPAQASTAPNNNDAIPLAMAALGAESAKATVVRNNAANSVSTSKTQADLVSRAVYNTHSRNYQNAVSEAAGELGMEEYKQRANIHDDARFIKRYHGPDDLAKDAEGKTVGLEAKGRADGKVTFNQHKSGRKQLSKKANLARAKKMLGKKKQGKIGRSSSRIGGAYTEQEMALYQEIKDNRGKKALLSTHTNSNTGEVKVVMTNQKGSLVSKDKFQIENYAEKKQKILKLLKRLL